MNKPTNYITIKENSSYLFVEERSKFIGYAFGAICLEDVDSHLNFLKKEHPFATHICYAYAVNTNIKTSDDNEPKGTAGLPILEVIKKNKLNCVLIAVVRYFGGVKLGAAGLIRAYSHTAAEVVKQSHLITKQLMEIYSVNCSFKDADKLRSLCFGNEISRIYLDTVIITFATPNKKEFEKELCSIFQSEVTLRYLGEEYINFV